MQFAHTKKAYRSTAADCMRADAVMFSLYRSVFVELRRLRSILLDNIIKH